MALAPWSPILLTSLFLVSAALSADEWTGFRGPASAGISAETGVFTELGHLGLQVAWKVEIGSGYPEVAVGDGKAVTMFAENGSDVIAAFDTADGRRLWTYTFAPTNRGKDGSHDGPIATPLIDGGRVFGLGPPGQLFALELATGEEVWAVHLAEEHGIVLPYYGFGSSPILVEGVLVVQLGGKGIAVGGFDPATGRLLWTAGSDIVQYQSPIPITLGGRRQVVAAGMQHLFGLDPKNGEVLWQWAYGGGGARGALSLVPAPAGERRLFLAHEDDASMAIELDLRDDGGVEVEKLWESRTIRNSYNVPVYLDGHLYGFSSRFLTAVDAATGESRWRSRQPGDGFLILVDRHLVIVTKKGSVHLGKATPEGFEEEAALPVFDDLVWSAPSFADGSIYVRSLGELARIDVTSGSLGRDIKLAREAESPAQGGTAFGRFLTAVENAPEDQRPALVDRFLDKQKTFPIIEDKDLVHFGYRGAAKDVALAGDMFGLRREEPMHRLAGTDFFYRSMKLESDARLNYLFMVDYEEIHDPRNPRRDTVSFLGPDMEIVLGGGLSLSWFAMPDWRAPAHLEEAPATARGSLVRHELESVPQKIAFEVYLPAGYESGEERYPTAYVIDGPLALKNGRMANSLDNLMGNAVAPALVVFLDIPYPSPITLISTSPSYEDALLKEVVPFVDTTYRTIAEPESRAVVGQGFGAFLAFTTALRHPGEFGKLASQSFFISTSYGDYLEPWIEKAGGTPLRVYMDWGRYDFRTPANTVDMNLNNRRLADGLRRRGIEVVGGEVNDSAGWPSWRNRTDRVFVALFPRP